MITTHRGTRKKDALNRASIEGHQLFLRDAEDSFAGPSLSALPPLHLSSSREVGTSVGYAKHAKHITNE